MTRTTSRGGAPAPLRSTPPLQAPANESRRRFRIHFFILKKNKGRKVEGAECCGGGGRGAVPTQTPAPPPRDGVWPQRQQPPRVFGGATWAREPRRSRAKKPISIVPTLWPAAPCGCTCRSPPAGSRLRGGPSPPPRWKESPEGDVTA